MRAGGAIAPSTPDLTIIYLTLNQHPENWTNFHRKILEDAIGDYPVITVSRKPTDLGLNLLDKEKPSHLNMYRQLLRAAKLVQTPYLATAEDDALYPPDHFSFFRPPMDTIAYDMARWSLYWWTPVFSIKQRISNSTLIAPTEEYVNALEERVAAFADSRPELVSEVGRYESNLGIKPRKIELRAYCDIPTVHFNPPNATDPLANSRRKRLGQLKAYAIPYWGHAEDIIKEYIS